MLKFLDQELSNILHQIRIALNQGVYYELSDLTCSCDIYSTSVLLVLSKIIHTKVFQIVGIYIWTMEKRGQYHD